MKRFALISALIPALAGLAALAMLPPAAQAAGRPGITAINISPQIASDNDRYVAFQRRNGMPVVLDTWRGTFKVLRGAWHCHPRDIGGGRVLMICPHSRPTKKNSGFHARTGSVRGGKTIPLVKSREISDAFEIGSYWVPVELPKEVYGPFRFAFLNWRTGALKKYRPTHWWAFGAMDLDHPRLGRADIQTFTPEVGGSLSPDSTVSVCRGRDVVITDWRGELRLWRDRNHSVLLGKGHLFYDVCQWHQSMRIGREWVTWSRGGALHAYNFRTGERFDRRYKPGSRITPIRDGVVVAVKRKRYGKYYTSYWVRLIRL
ncbi:MAG: hypothetical protein J0H66_13740 [Solirubrobacterales bacterium]|nr:hypothetical protein [Solirubrobacterales bacterium]OJU94469.1 MAG: hypothetical protein BGO23_03450 [Solirubrobacterales bacterium 67-14]